MFLFVFSTVQKKTYTSEIWPYYYSKLYQKTSKLIFTAKPSYDDILKLNFRPNS